MSFKIKEQPNVFDDHFLDIIGNEFKFDHVKGLAEWLKNSADAYTLKLLEGVEELTITDECQALAGEYVSRGIIPKKYLDDALHIAVAVVHTVSSLVSWNFEHIVKVKTRSMVGAIDAERGYSPIELIAPPEL